MSDDKNNPNTMHDSRDTSQPGASFAPCPGSPAPNKSPAEVFPVWDFVEEEMEARGWTLDDLVDHMPGDQALNRLTLEIMKAEPHMDKDIRRDMRLGEETASALAHAFGTSKDLWLKLDAGWVKQENAEVSDRRPAASDSRETHNGGSLH